MVKLYSITDCQFICLPITLSINTLSILSDQTRMYTLGQHTFILGQGVPRWSLLMTQCYKRTPKHS